MGLLEMLINYKWIILFYVLIVVLIYVFRKKFQFQAKFIALLRTKIGIKWIDRIGRKHSELIKILGYIGIGVGYIGMLVICGFLVKGIYDLIFVPSAPPVIAPIIPGVPIPGSPIFVPFWYGIISLFIVVLIHEFSHGIVARAHKVPIKNTGIVFFGPLIGAFVEPDEKKLEKKSDVAKYSVYAAGPFSNVITAVIALIITGLILTPSINAIAKPTGFSFTELDADMPAELAGLETNVNYNRVNGVTVLSTDELIEAFKEVEPGNAVTIGNAMSNYDVITTASQEDPNKAVIGVKLKTDFTNENNPGLKILLWLSGLFMWIFILSVGLGLANLLPLGPVDGGRMIKESFEKTLGKKKGHKVWVKMSVYVLVIIVILFVVPIIKGIINM